MQLEELNGLAGRACEPRCGYRYTHTKETNALPVSDTDPTEGLSNITQYLPSSRLSVGHVGCKSPLTNCYEKFGGSMLLTGGEMYQLVSCQMSTKIYQGPRSIGCSRRGCDTLTHRNIENILQM